MNDILFGNNNKAVIKKLAKRSFSSNTSRNAVALLAVFLTSFLICFVFSIGGSYIKSYELQQQQLLGTTGQATLNTPSESQYKILKQADGIAVVGLRADVVMPSFVTAGSDSDEANLYYGFRYYNSDEWLNHRQPILDGVVGHYPENSDEIMIPTWVLDKVGIANPKIEMELPFSYKAEHSQEAKERVFRLCGWFDEFDYVKDGTVAYLLVSEAFCIDETLDLWSSENTTADITFASTKDIPSVASALEQQLNLRAGQLLSVNPAILDGNSSLSIIGICIALGLGIMVCGYLLIYNVFYISVSNDVRFYGQLRTIGTTSKQIRKVIFNQARKIAVIGIASGLSASALLSYFLVPTILTSLTETANGTTIVFHPVIYIGAAAFSLVTVAVSVLKPARVAEQISPIRAYQYNAGNSNPKGSSVNRRLTPARLALKNVSRSKSKSMLVILSIFLGGTACMIVVSLVSSMSTDNFITSTLKSDIELANQTLSLGYGGEQTQVFDEEFFTELNAMSGVSSVSVQQEQTVIPSYSDELFYPYIENKYAANGTTGPDRDYYKEYPTRFYTQLVSVEPESLIDLFSESGWDLDAFRRGDFALLATDTPELFPADMTIDFSLGQIQQYEAVPDGAAQQITIGGFLPSSYYGGLSTDAPYMFVSNQAMEQIAPDAYISKVGINTRLADANTMLSSVKALCASSEISMISRVELSEGLKTAKITLYALGGGIAVVLAFIGIINFVNIMFTNITARKHELSIMESVGMTNKQCRRMLQMEGVWYALLSTACILTIGSVFLFLAYQIFQGAIGYAAFTYPIIPLALLTILLLVVCWSAPAHFLSRATKKSVIERLRIAE